MTEFRLFDAPGAEVAQIETDGNVFKPFVNAVATVADEVKLQVTEYGLEVQVVDAANVFMGDVFLSADAFDTYTVESETQLGVNVKELKKLIRRARKGAGDNLTLSLRERELTATVSRGYENHDVVSQGTMDLIDSDSIRSEPDMPDLDRSVDVTVNAPPLVDALSYGVGVADYVELSVKGVNQHTNALYIGGETDTRKESAAISNVDAEQTASSLYSADFMTAILDSISKVDPAEITVVYDAEFPITFDMERDGVPMHVRYMLAPRIKQ